MEVNETKKGLVTDILLNIRKLAESAETQLLNEPISKKSGVSL